MNILPEQQSALSELELIEEQGGALEILRADSIPLKGNQFLAVEISLAFQGICRHRDGIDVRQRERFVVFIPAGYPFELPLVCVNHKRWADSPHVQWTDYICLYLSPNVEWKPSDGMFGLIQRLDKWVKAAAVNQLDPDGAPLHPPIAYTSSSSTPLVVPQVDTPEVGTEPWIGFGCIEYRSEDRIDVVDWCDLDETPRTSSVAASILLPQPTPYEFPSNVRELFIILEEQGIPRRELIRILGKSVESNGEDTPLLILIGTPMRGVRGSGDYKQHIVAWLLEPTIATCLRNTLYQSSSYEKLRDIGRDVEEIILQWAETAEVNWCSVREARPEVTVRRDEASPLSWFMSKSVAIWGCGAIGSHLAESLARAGVYRLVLRDNSAVTPGVLVRQIFEDSDIGKNKAVATKERLQRAFPDLTIEANSGNVLGIPLDCEGWHDEVDIVIDATASWPVALHMEARRASIPDGNPIIASMGVGHHAQRALLHIVRQNHPGAFVDVARKAKIEAIRGSGLNHFVDDFWSNSPETYFQPEPGCSEPTFVGSNAEVAALVGMMLTKLSRELIEGGASSASSHLFTLPTAEIGDGERREKDFYYFPDFCLTEGIENYQIRISPPAWADLQASINRSARLSGQEVETGGHLFGERDDVAKVLWVSEVTGPPPDSRTSASEFVCGVEGVEVIANQKNKCSRGSVRFVGMWHTHPDGNPTPSTTDYDAMLSIVENPDFSRNRSILLVIGPNSDGPTSVAGALFSRGRVPSYRQITSAIASSNATVSPGPREPLDIGLALSGGGSRAIAFHLGCLRALHDRSILDRISVISAVSGGSVIAAMYGYSSSSFEDFDERVQRVLRKGLQCKIAMRYLFSRRILQSAGTVLSAGILSILADVSRSIILLILRFARLGDSRLADFIGKVRSPFRRWVSRTHAFEDTLRLDVLGDMSMSDERRDNVDLVINATELRTGSAFRFGSRESGIWRFGRVSNEDIKVTKAVAASAAYPILLPAFDEVMEFRKNSGKYSQRVVLADGGIYDNLGTSCLEPGRSSAYSFNVYHPQYIISCDAGAGIFDTKSTPYWWPSRVIRSTQAIFRKAQDGVRSRLFHFQSSGQIKGFVLSYLGTQDKALPHQPPDLVPRDKVFDYPTDFAAMSQEDIDRIALRGEQITRMLISWYVPEL